MKQLIISVIFLCYGLMFSQTSEPNHSSFDVNYITGNILLHNPNVLHLIKEHPEGVILSWNKKTYGKNDWEQRYNYPDYGVSLIHQNFKNEVLGHNIGLYAHYNFYFFNRELMFRIGQGLAYATNPYDRVENHKNIAFGSKILSSTYAMLLYKKENIVDQFGIQVGLSFIHFSNANVKAPNTSVNSISFNIGVNYNLEATQPEYQYNLEDDKKFTEPWKFNFVFRGGINESDIVGSGQFPFYIFSAYTDKRINRKSALQFGADLFYSKFLKELIYYESVAVPENNVNGNEDYRRAGVFVGHELFINKLSLVTQFGYYFYYPFDFEGQFYQRIGLKRYFGNKWFAALTLKTHAAKAEAVELGIGIRL